VLADRARALRTRIDRSIAEIHERELETLKMLAKAGEFRDTYTANHLLRMARYCALIGHNLGLNANTVDLLAVTAPMHDIGKVGIPDSILLKKGSLTADEIGVLQTHTQIGYDILKGSPSKYLSTGAIIALSHHEKYDGSGYPNGLLGGDIPIVARVVAVADVFDALISARPYKAAWAVEPSIAYLRNGRGTYFDPACVDAFLADPVKVEMIVKELAD
jgi:response regulator RpfG family c-di-GMP phosphodiesterase